MKLRSALLLPLAILAVAVACSSKDDSPDPGDKGDASVGTPSPDANVPDQPAATEGCTTLCAGVGFASGKETDFNNGLVECLCSGGDGEVDQSGCEKYCAAFGVSAANAFVTIEQSPKNDKCVCDGTKK